MPPAFPRLMPAVGSSCESPNASLYTVVCFRGLLRLSLTTAGAVDGGGSLSSRGTIRSAEARPLLILLFIPLYYLYRGHYSVRDYIIVLKTAPLTRFFYLFR
jgi:hypothetical protein